MKAGTIMPEGNGHVVEIALIHNCKQTHCNWPVTEIKGGEKEKYDNLDSSMILKPLTVKNKLYIQASSREHLVSAWWRQVITLIAKKSAVVKMTFFHGPAHRWTICMSLYVIGSLSVHVKLLNNSFNASWFVSWNNNNNNNDINNNNNNNNNNGLHQDSNWVWIE